MKFGGRRTLLGALVLAAAGLGGAEVIAAFRRGEEWADDAAF
jgi:hypothetical protein